MITTIITTYRRPLLLKRAVNSVLNQTFSDFQICVYDNASDDETEEIMRNLAQKDPRIKYHRHEKNIGMMENYQYAFDRITSPYFHLLSDDDYLLPDFYNVALKGFEEFPGAAISACGILQVNENGDFVGNPLESWKKEGLYQAEEGMLEMISKHQYPVPTGILFQKKFTENIKPELNTEVQIYWDPDYLIQISARYPIVINKKHCGIYLVHSESFAYSVYSNILHTPSNTEIYLKATSKVLERIKNSPSLSRINKTRAQRLFKSNICNDTFSFTKSLIFSNKCRAAHFTLNAFYKHIGFSFLLISFHTLIISFKAFQLLILLLEKSVNLNKRRFKQTNNNQNSCFIDELERHNIYGKDLLND